MTTDLVAVAHRCDYMVNGMAATIDDHFAPQLKARAYTHWQALLTDLANTALNVTAVVIEDRMTDKVTALEQVTTLRSGRPLLKILVLSPFYDRVFVLGLLEAGASGYLCLSDRLSMLLPDALRAALGGGCYLSPSVSAVVITDRDQRRFTLTSREREAVALLAEGCNGQQIASRLGVSTSQLYRLYGELRAAFNVLTNEALIHRLLILGFQI